uniref:DnaJ heat shock protein family (Hsp40) member C4 n=1 Tax=Pelusios castaneus TaxID=367368 RepID=A0A8C8R9H0_9SAUR
MFSCSVNTTSRDLKHHQLSVCCSVALKIMLSTLHLVCQCCFRYRSATQRAFSSTLSNWSGCSNYYDVLGIKQDATMEEIKQAFFAKSKKLHPDSDPSNPDLHSQFVQLNTAYQVLSKESSRQLYNSQRAWSFAGSSPKHDPSDFPKWGPRSRARSWGPDENMRYWQQFHPPPFTSSERQNKERERCNQLLFRFCLLLTVSSLGIHYLIFRVVEDMHNNFMDEKDKIITDIYNKSKEQARVNGLKKQQEILRQNHSEFIERYRIRRSAQK